MNKCIIINIYSLYFPIKVEIIDKSGCIILSRFLTKTHTKLCFQSCKEKFYIKIQYQNYNYIRYFDILDYLFFKTNLNIKFLNEPILNQYFELFDYNYNIPIKTATLNFS